MAASVPSVSMDRSVQLPIMMPPTWELPTTARASAAFLTPTIRTWASLSRVDIAARSPQNGGAGAAGTWSGPDIGVTALDSAPLTCVDDSAAVRVGAEEQPASSSGTAVNAAKARRDTRETIRTWWHDARRTRKSETGRTVGGTAGSTGPAC